MIDLVCCGIITAMRQFFLLFSQRKKFRIPKICNRYVKNSLFCYQWSQFHEHAHLRHNHDKQNENKVTSTTVTEMWRITLTLPRVSRSHFFLCLLVLSMYTKIGFSAHLFRQIFHLSYIDRWRNSNIRQYVRNHWTPIVIMDAHVKICTFLFVAVARLRKKAFI